MDSTDTQLDPLGTVDRPLSSTEASLDLASCRACQPAICL